MRLFKKEFIIDLKKTDLNLKYLDVNGIQELFNFEFKVFVEFEELQDDSMLMRIELPKALFYMQLLVVVFFLVFIVIYETNIFKIISLIIVQVMVFLLAGFISQIEFIKKVTIFFNKITSNDFEKIEK